MLKKYFIYFLGNFGSKIINFLIVPFYTVLISPSDFGRYDYYLTLTSFLVIFVSLNFFDLTYKELIDKNTYEEKIKKISKMLFVVVFQTIIVILIYLFILVFKGFNLIDLTITLIIIMNNIYSFFNQGISRGLEKNISMSISSFITSIVSVSLSLIFAYKFLEFDNISIVELLLLSQLSGVLLATIYLMFSLKEYLKSLNFEDIKLIERNDIFEWLKFCLPLIPNTLSWWILYLSARLFLVYYVGEESNGIYSMASRFPGLLFVLNFIFSLVWQDENLKNKNIFSVEKFNKNLVKFVHFQFVFLFLFMILFYYSSPYLLKNEYALGTPLVPIISLGIVFSGISSFYNALYFMSGKTNGIFLSSVISSICFIIINFIFIKNWGMYTVAFSTTISYIVMASYRAIDLRKKLNTRFPLKLSVLYIILFFGIFCLIYI